MTIELINDTANCVAAEIATGVTVTKGALCAINSSGNIVLADANGTEWTDFPARGFAMVAGTAGERIALIRKGKLDGFSSLTVGKDVYLSETAGGVVQTAPSDSDDCVQKVGYAIAADTIVVELEEHSTVA